jgi:hypothetical protein
MKETNCGHAECKSFYMMNKQMCMFDNTQPQISNLLKNSNSLFQPQVQVKTLLPQPINISSIGQQIINAKRNSSPSNDDEQEDGLMKKKIKSEAVGFTAAGFQPVSGDDSLKQPDQKQAYYNDLQSKLSEFGQFTQFSGNNIPTSLLSSLLNAQGAAGNNQQDGGFAPNSIVVPIIQNSQNNLGLLNNLQNTTVLPVQQNGMNPLSQFLAQSMKVNPSPMNGQPQMNQTIMDNKPKNDGFCNEAFLKDFQARTFNLLFTQNKMLTDLREKNDMLQDTLACLINEINLLKNTVKHNQQEAPAASMTNSHPITAYQNMGNSTETMTVENLMSFLYGPNPDFNYQLVLKSDLQLPLYRERNFKFTVLLTDRNGNPVENTNRIPLTIGIYSSENPPKFIDSNTAGNKILKGFIDKDMVNGTVTFDKVQIKEVTSHFRNGWVFFVVYPKVSGQSGASGLSQNGLVVNAQKIKPLILEKVIVKAKKAKEKDDEKDEKEDKMNEEKLEKEEEKTETAREDSDD